jgi:hypothetical protein
MKFAATMFLDAIPMGLAAIIKGFTVWGPPNGLFARPSTPSPPAVAQ